MKIERVIRSERGARSEKGEREFRSEREFRNARIPGAVLIPWDELPRRLDEVPRANGWCAASTPRASTIVSTPTAISPLRA